MKKRLLILVAFLSVIVIGNAQKTKSINVYPTESKIINDICFTNRGENIGIADNNTIKVFATISKKLLAEFKDGHKSQILAIDISKDSTLLVSGDKNGTIVLWDFVTRNKLKTFSYHKGAVTTLNISPDRRYLVSGDADKKVYLYDLEKNKVVRVFTDHSKVITSVKFSSDTKLLATASGDKTIKIYNLESLKLITSLNAHRSWVREISFSKDVKRLLSCSCDASIIKWDISDIHKIKIMERWSDYFGWMTSVDFNEENTSFVYGNQSGKAQIKINRIGGYKMKIGVPINKIRFKPNDGIYLRIAIATRGKGVIFMDAKDMKE
jgi:WD40 repeat protein